MVDYSPSLVQGRWSLTRQRIQLGTLDSQSHLQLPQPWRLHRRTTAALAAHPGGLARCPPTWYASVFSVRRPVAVATAAAAAGVWCNGRRPRCAGLPSEQQQPVPQRCVLGLKGPELGGLHKPDARQRSRVSMSPPRKGEPHAVRANRDSGRI